MVADTAPRPPAPSEAADTYGRTLARLLLEAALERVRVERGQKSAVGSSGAQG